MTGPTAGCPRCGEPVAPADRFCEGCGADQHTVRGGAPHAAAVPSCPRCGEPAAPGSGYCTGCGLRRPDGTDHVEADLGALAGVSDRGRVHRRNEDAMALGRRDVPGSPRLAAVVCDGVSSAPGSDAASRAAADAALSVLLSDDSPSAAPLPAAERIRAAVAAAASAVAALRGPGRPDGPACTLVAGLVEPGAGDAGPRITVGWVGDSRAYWLSPAGSAEPSRQLTCDHSLAVELAAAGVTDPRILGGRAAHTLTRWLGSDTAARTDVVALRPAAPGVLLLCSDGLWNDLPDADRLAAEVLPPLRDGAAPLPVAARLTTLALDAGGHDNITVVLVPLPYRTTPRTAP